MSDTSVSRWEEKRTDESRLVEEVLRNAGFAQVDAYRYNLASIRVRVIDPRFEGLNLDQRDELVEPHLQKLPERTQGDIITLHTFAPSELASSERLTREAILNAEFEDPSPSML